MALLDREHEQVRFTEFKSAFKQTFTTTPPSGTFYGQNPSGNHDYHNKERRDRTRSKDRATGRHRDSRPRNKSPHRPRRDSTHSPAFRDKNSRSGFALASTLMAPVKQISYWILGNSAVAWGRTLSPKWGVI
jgi:hypothetical protein